MNGIEVTPDRQRALRLTRPYYVYTLQLVVRANDDRIGARTLSRKVENVTLRREERRLIEPWL